MTHKIQWLNMPGYKGETWNPIIGCSKVSEGCQNCYAEKMAYRISKMDLYNNINAINYSLVVDWDNKGWNSETTLVPTALEKPLHWKKPRIIFVCSMGDLFHESVPFDWVMNVMNIIEDSPQHLFLILTKRPARMRHYFGSINQMDSNDKILQNLWLGVTTENQNAANERIPVLLEIPAAKRFVSIEPMLGEVDLNNIKQFNSEDKHIASYQVLKPITSCGDSNRPALDWVIVGGESGHKARPMHPDWVRSIREQCKAANVPFLFKQWGEWGAYKFGGTKNTSGSKEFNWCERGLPFQWMCKVGRKSAGRDLDGVTHDEYPIGIYYNNNR